MNKIDATKYILLKLCDWYFEINPSKKQNRDNDLSILKALKLIFLLAPIKFNNNSLLSNGFTFEAWALGPVEVDIYASKDQLYIDLLQKKVQYDELHDSLENIQIDVLFLDNIVETLKSKNKYLINLSATQLVNLTHKYSSWITTYNSMNSKLMQNELIITEEKFYFYDSTY
ncbi:hypothetical protein [Flavobacterium sp.]|uniref:hypothetical protein n=1 Tax=Flavobacterium sp. TaxID=239 RepID=UPI003D0B6A1F